MDLIRKKAMMVMSLLLIACIVLSGCGKVDMAVRIYSDGTGEYIISRSLQIDKVNKKLKAAGIGKDERDGFWEELENQGFEKSQNGEYYVSAVGGNIEKGTLKKQFKGYDEDSYASADTVYFELDVKNTPSMAELLAEIDELNVKLSDKDVTAHMSFEFDNPIVHTTGKIDPENPCRVTFDCNIGEKLTVFASTNESITVKSFKKPSKVKLNKFKVHSKKGKKTRKVEIKVKKQKLATKYQAHYADNKSFKKYKKVSSKKTSFYIKNLKKDKKYYIRIRAVRKLYNNQTVYGRWIKREVESE